MVQPVVIATFEKDVLYQRKTVNKSSLMSKIQTVRAVDQVVLTLRKYILDGTYSIGTRLPAERTLVSDLGVNRLTLRAAISHLEAEGLLRAQQGQGVTVCDFYQTASLELLKYLSLDERLTEVLSLRQFYWRKLSLRHVVMPVRYKQTKIHSRTANERKRE